MRQAIVSYLIVYDIASDSYDITSIEVHMIALSFVVTDFDPRLAVVNSGLVVDQSNTGLSLTLPVAVVKVDIGESSLQREYLQLPLVSARCYHSGQSIE